MYVLFPKQPKLASRMHTAMPSRKSTKPAPTILQAGGTKSIRRTQTYHVPGP